MRYSKWSDFNVTAKLAKQTVRVIGTNPKFGGLYWMVTFPDGTLDDRVKPSELTEWNWSNIAEEQNKEPEKRRRGRPRKDR